MTPCRVVTDRLTLIIFIDFLQPYSSSKKFNLPVNDPDVCTYRGFTDLTCFLLFLAGMQNYDLNFPWPFFLVHQLIIAASALLTPLYNRRPYLRVVKVTTLYKV